MADTFNLQDRTTQRAHDDHDGVVVCYMRNRLQDRTTLGVHDKHGGWVVLFFYSNRLQLVKQHNSRGMLTGSQA
jgi:hypothetical protein